MVPERVSPHKTAASSAGVNTLKPMGPYKRTLKRKKGEEVNKKGIFNLSQKILTNTEIKVLNKGLKFAPTKQMDKFSMYIDLQRFKRKLSLKKYFLKTPIINNTAVDQDKFVHTSLKNKSKFFPRHVISNEIKMFESLVSTDIDRMGIKEKKHNLTKEEKKAIKDLDKDETIIIKPADKGGGIVIWSKEAYNEESLRILGDERTYIKLKNNPIIEIRNNLHTLLQDGRDKEILTEREFRYLMIEHIKTPHFYILPKIHKNATKPPGRPIIAGINSITSCLSEYIDVLLQPIVKETLSYLKDTINMLQILDKVKWDEDCIMVTCDVNALYSNIPHAMGLQTVREEIYNSKNFLDMQIDFIMRSIHFILNNNYFKFGDDFFLQKNGTAMGTKFAPSYANLYMTGWESRFVYGSHSWAHNILVYKRFIDDVFFIWKGSEEDLILFLDSLDNQDWGITLDRKWSKERVTFLDLEVYISEGTLKCKTFFKEVDVNTYINTASCHDPSWLKGVPKGQFMRLRRNCSDLSTFEQQANQLKDNFIEKGYDAIELDMVINKLKQEDRGSLLQYKPKKNTKEGEVLFICDYNSKAKNLKKIIKKHWHILRRDKDLNDILGEQPKVVFRGVKNLKANLVHSKPKNHKKRDLNQFNLKNGYYVCGQCLACRSTANRKNCITEYTNRKSGQKIQMKEVLNCCSKSVIYLLECPCGLQYIGRTKRALNIRISEHVRNIRKLYDNHSVSLHFKLKHGGSPFGLKFMAMKKIYKVDADEDIVSKLGREEMRSIYEMGTMAPNGLNNDFEVVHFL
uniref:Helix-turn-helix domain-containing protein n=1 Tax=Leptobrachium leishanense TaxID=445787 RepID=A0A8C5W849_9ANUR